MPKPGHYHKEELEKHLAGMISPFELAKVLSAYEISENAHLADRMPDYSRTFDHISRICRIIVVELGIIDNDIISASLLKLIYQSGDKIDREIIEYNFGPYVRLLTDILNDDLHNPEEEKFTELHLDSDENRINLPGDDFLLIRLAEILDYLRNIEFNPVYNPVNLIIGTCSKYLKLADANNNEAISYLAREIRKERNKILD